MNYIMPDKYFQENLVNDIDFCLNMFYNEIHILIFTERL